MYGTEWKPLYNDCGETPSSFRPTSKEWDFSNCRNRNNAMQKAKNILSNKMRFEVAEAAAVVTEAKSFEQEREAVKIPSFKDNIHKELDHIKKSKAIMQSSNEMRFASAKSHATEAHSIEHSSETKAQVQKKEILSFLKSTFEEKRIQLAKSGQSNRAQAKLATNFHRLTACIEGGEEVEECITTYNTVINNN
eukprot:g3100.t1